VGVDRRQRREAPPGRREPDQPMCAASKSRRCARGLQEPVGDPPPERSGARAGARQGRRRPATAELAGPTSTPPGTVRVPRGRGTGVYEQARSTSVSRELARVTGGGSVAGGPVGRSLQVGVSRETSEPATPGTWSSRRSGRSGKRSPVESRASWGQAVTAWRWGGVRRARTSRGRHGHPTRSGGGGRNVRREGSPFWPNVPIEGATGGGIGIPAQGPWCSGPSAVHQAGMVLRDLGSRSWSGAV
jgi:hypothetical protein